MYVVFALMIDDYFHNLFREVSYECFQETSNFDNINLILPHISLKQSFRVSNILEIRNYFDSYFSTVKQFTVDIDKFEIVHDNNHPLLKNILWLKIHTNNILTTMHTELNASLEKLGIEKGIYDGDNYTFHATVMLGPTNLSLLKEKLDKLKHLNLNKQIKITKALMFLCPFDYIDFKKIITYRLIELQK
ncbi:MAG: 2'-5' RNA ligase family protein [Candidatus Cloacimonetes bacterium]|nr:2'-5' RNA ligase family protein [Candidatus Cloacimonadota bacterium]MDD4155625.1 2'-5' RNA ligase family protein [Candidatus Cloacimonadota bacterium]